MPPVVETRPASAARSSTDCLNLVTRHDTLGSRVAAAKIYHANPPVLAKPVKSASCTINVLDALGQRGVAEVDACVRTAGLSI